MRFVKPALLCTAALLSAQADAAITYVVDGTVGSGTISGTLTTDGTLGTLFANNFTTWDLTVTGAGGVVDTLTTANSGVFTSGAKLTADATNIYFDFTHDDAAASYFLIQKNFSSGTHYVCGANATYGLTPCLEGVSLVPESYGSASASFATPTGQQIVGTVAGVPEPASWALMIAGFGLAGAALRRRPAARVRFA